MISIIIPVYNVEAYLSKCIDSIINQTYKDLEIILVDDESPDNCPQICDQYAALDSRIKVIHKANGGLSCARNSGLEAATGEYIGFVDSDDYIHPTMYELLLKALEEQDADISICDFYWVYDNSDHYSTNGFMDEEIRVNSNIEALQHLLGPKGFVTSITWNKIYKRELFGDLRFPAGKIHEDEYTTYKLLYKASKVVYINAALYYYYQRNNGIMGQTGNPKRLDRLDALKERVLFFKNLNEQDLYNQAAVKYFEDMMSFYSMFKKNREITKRIRQRYRDDHNKIELSGISRTKKAKINLFRVFPSFATWLLQAKKQIKTSD